MEPSYMKDIPLRPHPPLKDGETLSGPQILLRNPLTRFPPFGRMIKAQSMEKKLNNHNTNWGVTGPWLWYRLEYVLPTIMEYKFITCPSLLLERQDVRKWRKRDGNKLPLFAPCFHWQPFRQIIITLRLAGLYGLFEVFDFWYWQTMAVCFLTPKCGFLRKGRALGIYLSLSRAKESH